MKLVAADWSSHERAQPQGARIDRGQPPSAAPDGTACSCDLEGPVGKSQATVSHHLSVLADAGLITKQKVGRWVNCTVVPGRLAQLRDVLGR